MCRELPRSGGISRLRALCITISDDRGDESFADDLNMGRGIVSGRVALLLRSTEIRPHRPNDLSQNFPRPSGGDPGSGGREGEHLAKTRPGGTWGKGGGRRNPAARTLCIRPAADPHPLSHPYARGEAPCAQGRVQTQYKYDLHFIPVRDAVIPRLLHQIPSEL